MNAEEQAPDPWSYSCAVMLRGQSMRVLYDRVVQSAGELRDELDGFGWTFGKDTPAGLCEWTLPDAEFDEVMDQIEAHWESCGGDEVLLRAEQKPHR